MIEKGALVRRIVTTGRRDRNTAKVEVLNGLKPDAQVLAARFFPTETTQGYLALLREHGWHVTPPNTGNPPQ